jgi:hypothetical protein
MSIPSRNQKQYQSAHRRLLSASIGQFFETNFPRWFGPEIRQRVAQQLLDLIETTCPALTALRPGQCVWQAVAIDTRADSAKLRLVPVVLTLVDEDDITRLAAGESRSTINQAATARLLDEAYQQGALLSMRDLGLLTWHAEGQMTQYRKAWETAHGRPLPHPGNLQDMGTCISHKTSIVTKTVYEKKDPCQVARETHHTQSAVDRYLRAFHRVRTCYEQTPDQDYICQVTGMSAHLVSQYLNIIQTYEAPESGQSDAADGILNVAGAEDRATLGNDTSAAQACTPRRGDTMSPHTLGIQNKAKNPKKPS